MGKIGQNNLIYNLYKYIPIILLFISVLNEFDFNNLGLKYFSFNFSYILIFYYSLKKSSEFILKLVKRKNIQSFIKLGLKVIFLR